MKSKDRQIGRTNTVLLMPDLQASLETGSSSSRCQLFDGESTASQQEQWGHSRHGALAYNGDPSILIIAGSLHCHF